MKRKESEIKELIDQITDRIGDKLATEKKLAKSQENEKCLKQEILAINDSKRQVMADMEKLRGQMSEVQEQKEFYHQSALESKKEKNLLKIALTRLDRENEELKARLLNRGVEKSYSQLDQLKLGSLATLHSEKSEPSSQGRNYGSKIFNFSRRHNSATSMEPMKPEQAAHLFCSQNLS